MWVKFIADLDFSPTARGGRVTIAYLAGMVENVTRECAGQAIALNRAEKVKGKGKNNGQDADGQ